MITIAKNHFIQGAATIFFSFSVSAYPVNNKNDVIKSEDTIQITISLMTNIAVLGGVVARAEKR